MSELSTLRPSHPTVADLLDGPLREAEILGGRAGLGAEVRGVGIWGGEDEAYVVGPGEVVFVGYAGPVRGRGPIVEILLRQASCADASALILPAGVLAPLSTTRLADRLGLPLVALAPGQGVLSVAATLQAQADAVPRADVEVLLALSDRLSECRELSEIQAALSQALDAPVTLAAADRGVLAGEAALADDLPGDDWAGGQLSVGTMTLIAHSTGAEAKVAPVWIIVGDTDPTQRWLVLADRALRLARGHVCGIEARRRLSEARSRAANDRLMTEILQAPERASPMLAAQARRHGFRLGGWHIGIALAVRGAVPSALVLEALRGATAESGQLTPFLRTSAGWVAWVSSEDAPSSSVVRALGVQLRQAVQTLRQSYPQGRVMVGVGASARDVAGVARTVGQAQQAVLVAGTGSADSVQIVQDLGASSLLLGWYGSGLFREAAHDILAPLRAVGDEEMIRTLTAYLDRACSASHSARALGVHRNTVNQRIARVERLLGVTLADSDTRLALQLALRAHGHPRTRT